MCRFFGATSGPIFNSRAGHVLLSHHHNHQQGLRLQALTNQTTFQQLKPIQPLTTLTTLTIISAIRAMKAHLQRELKTTFTKAERIYC